MKSSGAFFTWNNKTDGTDRVQSKIDRVLINTEWLTQMPAAEEQRRKKAIQIFQYVESSTRVQNEGAGKL
ncbi:hypothetical protein KY284_033046 [Solanum tuberosum]|nr:hypothetical protein KY284_033046 [Solanum tuberosum]